ncbi:CGNR zinc finger domain-containing protein [Lapillicoccus jejuensis]|uniref:Putative RNA-binding Zn ribbon-like protein n=1 Tax=Lapillicoccus jejuensis TaxID=402171 RepID=A0A542DYR9_9MICO|nr:CGNR zinc finger domain-containing protein [Lapillicoccus jejuensis]TQJ08074.1 putative RNA-binding Zn ribbon-like protein [Lapillicoccus jejuensis]
MQFDSHVRTLLAAACALVDGLTPGHDGTTPYDVPRGPAAVAAARAALVSQGRASRVTAAQAAELAGWAERVRAVFAAGDAGRVDEAARLVNALLDDTSARPRLDRFDDGWSLHFHGPDDGVVLGWMAGIASALALVVGSAWAGRLGVCDADPCDRVFLDETRNGTRRYCSPRCQSRVKAAAHRARAAT